MEKCIYAVLMHPGDPGHQESHKRYCYVLLFFFILIKVFWQLLDRNSLPDTILEKQKGMYLQDVKWFGTH